MAFIVVLTLSGGLGYLAGVVAYNVALSNKSRYPWLWALVTVAVVSPLVWRLVVTLGTSTTSTTS